MTNRSRLRGTLFWTDQRFGRSSLDSFIVVCGLAWLLQSSNAHAGMPVPSLIITELGKRRLEEISFFFVSFLLLTAVVRWLWNGLAKDFPAFPRLSYRGALCFTVLWGLALTVVLSLVSGARELMTPAAWEPNGVTYRIAQQKPSDSDQTEAMRRERILRLKELLWKYAADHDGRFPSQISELPTENQVADASSGMSYALAADLSLTSARTVLLQEPDIYSQRFALLTDGSVIEIKRESEVAR